MVNETKQIKVNLPLDVKRWVAMEAAKNLRSQGAEIVLALKEKMARQEKEKGDA